MAQNKQPSSSSTSTLSKKVKKKNKKYGYSPCQRQCLRCHHFNAVCCLRAESFRLGASGELQKGEKGNAGNNIHGTRPQCCSKACRFCDRTTLAAAQAVMHTFCSSALSSMVTEGIAVCLGTAIAAETRCGRTAPESDLPFRARGVTAEFRETGS